MKIKPILCKNIIQFTLIERKQEHIVKTNNGAYANLMYLIRDLFLFDNDFGECGGMGKCATCLVEAKNLKGNAAIKSRNEPETLKKYKLDHPKYRLSCQVYINKDLDGASIKVLDFD